MNNGKIVSGGKEVIYECDFLTFDEQPCQITFDYTDVSFLFEFRFLEDENTKDPSVSISDDGPNFYLALTNFNSPFGQGNVEPINPGKVGDRPLYFRYWVSKPGERTKARNVKLTVYLEGVE